MLIQAEGERFDVSARLGSGNQRSYDFSWLDGPAPSYGFTIGSTSASTEFSIEELQVKAGEFVRAFFSPGGIGPSDFAEFVASRRDGD